MISCTKKHIINKIKIINKISEKKRQTCHIINSRYKSLKRLQNVKLNAYGTHLTVIRTKWAIAKIKFKETQKNNARSKNSLVYAYLARWVFICARCPSNFYFNYYILTSRSHPKFFCSIRGTSDASLYWLYLLFLFYLLHVSLCVISYALRCDPSLL